MQGDLELSDLLFKLLKRWPWLLVAGIVGAAAAYGYVSRQPVVYRATADLQVGRFDGEFIEEPHTLAEIINTPGFLQKTETEDDIPAEGGKKKKKRQGGGGTVSAECLETGRKRERIVYLIRVTADSQDKTTARATVEEAAKAAIERNARAFEEKHKLFKDREAELAARIDELQKSSPASQSEITACRRDLFEVRSKLVSSETFPTRLAHPTTAPEVLSSPRPFRSAAVGGIAAIVLAACAVLAVELIGPILSRSAPSDGKAG